jgi:hypothetical protein
MDILHQCPQLRIVLDGKGANIPHEGPPQINKVQQGSIGCSSLKNTESIGVF